MPMIVLGNTLLIYSSNLCLEEQIKDEKISKCVSSNSYLVSRDSHIQDANRPKRTETCMRFGTCSRNIALLEYSIDPIGVM